jgi:hypothetical protein
MKGEKDWDKQKQEAFQKAWPKIIAKAWSDPTYKQRLLHDPLSIFKENGIEFPQGVSCKINESNDKIIQLTLPQKPSGEISEETLRKIAGGAGSGFSGGGICERS